MGFAGYLRTRLGEFLFCSLAASALVYTLFSGFYACQPLQAWPEALGVVGACTALTFVLYCIAYRTASAVVGSVLLALALGAALAACAAANPEGAPLADVEGNYTLAVGIAAAACVLTFVASRRKATTIALLVSGVALCALIEYLYRYGHVVALCAFVVGVAGLIVVRAYQRALLSSDSDALSFGSVAACALALALASVAVSAGVYYLVVQPLDPPGVQLRLIVEHRSQEEVEIRGIGSVTGDASGGDGNLANGEEQQSSQTASDNLFDTMQGDVAQLLGMELDQEGDVGTTTALLVVSFIALIIVGAILLAVLAAILVRKAIRKRRYRAMTANGGASEVRGLYLFFLDRFARLGMPRPDNLSLAEYARDFSSAFARFERFTDPARTVSAQGPESVEGLEVVADAANMTSAGNAQDAESAGNVSRARNADPARTAAPDAPVGSAVPDSAPADSTVAPAESARTRFEELTGVYIETVYGRDEADARRVALFEGYYRTFYKNARRYAGRFKYLYLFFRL